MGKQQTPASKQVKRPRTFRRRLMWGGIAVVMIPLLLVLLMHVPFAQRAILDFALGRLESAGSMQVDFGTFRWKPFSYLELRNLKVQTAGEQILDCDRVALSYQFSSSKPYFRPLEVILEKPSVNLRKDATGGWVLPQFKTSEKEPPAAGPPGWLLMPLPRIRLAEGHISAHDADRPVLDIGGLDLEVLFRTAGSPDSPALEVQLAQFGAEVSEPAVGPLQLTGATRVQTDTVQLEGLQLKAAGGSEVTLEGTWSLASPRDGTLTLRLQPLNLAEIPAAGRAGQRLGKLEGLVQLAGRDGTLTLQHDLKSDRGGINGELKLDPETKPVRTVHWQARFDKVPVPVPRTPLEPELTGTLDATIRGDRMENLAAALSLEVQASMGDKQIVSESKLAGTFEDGRASITQLDVKSVLGVLTGHGFADIKGLWDDTHAGSVELHLKLDKGNLEPVLAGASEPVQSAVELVLHYGPGQLKDWHQWQGETQIQLSIPKVVEADLSGKVAEQTFDVQYNLNVSDLKKVSDFVPGWQGAGRIRSKGAFSGKWPDLIWKGTVDASGLKTGPLQLEQVSAKGEGGISGKEVHKQLTLKGKGIEVSGYDIRTLDLTLEQQQSTVTFRVDAGRILDHGAAHLVGTVENMWSPEPVVALKDSQITWKKAKMQLAGQVGVDFENRRARIQSFEGVSGEQHVELQGSVAETESNDVSLKWNRVRLENWLPLFLQENYVSGVTTGSAHLTGTRDDPKIALDIELAQGSGQRVALKGKVALKGDSDLDLHWENLVLENQLRPFIKQPPVTGVSTGAARFTGPIAKPRVSLNATLRKGGESVQLSGHYSHQAESDLQLSFENLTVQDWVGQFVKEPALTGRATGKASLSGSPAQPVLKLSGTVVKGSIGKGKSFDRMQLEASYGQDTLTANAELQLGVIRTPVRAAVQLPASLSLQPFKYELRRDGPFEASVKVGGFRLEDLLPYANTLKKLQGQLDVDVRVVGTMAQPQITAEVKVSDALVVVKAWPNPIERIHLDLGVRPKQLEIRSAGLSVLGGNFTLKGTAELPPWDKFDLKLGPKAFENLALNLEAATKDFKVPEFYGIEGEATGKVTLKGNLKRPVVKGELKLAKAKLNLGELETDIAKNIKVIEDETDSDIVVLDESKEKKRKDNLYNHSDLDLSFNLPATGTWVRGKGLDAEITGAISVKKRYMGPIKLFGSLKTNRGTYTFQGNQVDITEGGISFVGVTPPDPNLRIVGEKSVQDVIVRVHVTGPISAPKLSFSSVPAMSQVDILSYLLMGRPAGDLSSKESIGLQEKAASLVGTEASRMLKDVLGKTPFTPDVLEFHNSENGAGGVVEVGKYLTPDFYVTYEKGLDGEETDQIRMEYRINRHLSIESQFGREQDSGVDILWRHDF